MFSTFALPFSLPRIFKAASSRPSIAIPSVEVHDVELLHEKRARTLKHLLKLNHVNHSIVYHNLQFHNHMPHVCSPHFQCASMRHPKLTHMDRSLALPIFLKPHPSTLTISTRKNLRSWSHGKTPQGKSPRMTGGTT